MSRVVTLLDFTPGARDDGIPWTSARMEESSAFDGPFTQVEAYVFGTGGQPGPDSDPRAPQARDFTTQLAQLSDGYYRIVFIDAGGHEQPVGPVHVPQFAQSYTSLDALRRALSPDGAQDDSTAASLADDDLEQAVSEAVAEVDSRLSARYTVPLSDVPPVIQSVTRDIAAYLATLTFRRGDPIDSNDPVQLRYNRAQALLTALQTGKAELPTSTGPLAQAQDEAEVVNPYEGDLFLPSDFALSPAPYRGAGFPFTGYDDGSL